MSRLLGLTLAAFASLFMLVAPVAAVTPWGTDEHVIVSTGGPFTLPKGQQVDLLVVVSGDATIEGEAKGIVVVNGTVNLVGTTTTDVLAIRSLVVLDATSAITGDVNVLDSTVDAPPAAIGGTITDLGPQLAGGWVFGDIARFVLFAGFLLGAMCMTLGLAAVASRQVRQAGSTISREPVKVVAAAFVGVIAIATFGAIAVATIVGAPTGLAILVFGLPALLVGGYAVMAIWLGELVLARATPGVERARPYLAAVVGVAALGMLSIIPVVGGLVVFAGFGALVLFLWRTVRAGATSRTAQTSAVASPA